MKLLVDILALIIIPLIIAFAVGIILAERDKRKRAEQELETTKKALKDLCEACIKENNSPHARRTYVAYFGKPVNHTGDGFIDGYE